MSPSSGRHFHALDARAEQGRCSITATAPSCLTGRSSFNMPPGTTLPQRASQGIAPETPLHEGFRGDALRGSLRFTVSPWLLWGRLSDSSVLPCAKFELSARKNNNPLYFHGRIVDFGIIIQICITMLPRGEVLRSTEQLQQRESCGNVSNQV